MSSRGRNAGFKVLGEFICQAIPNQDFGKQGEAKDTHVDTKERGDNESSSGDWKKHDSDQGEK
jgi:hypothetical protein